MAPPPSTAVRPSPAAARGKASRPAAPAGMAYSPAELARVYPYLQPGGPYLHLPPIPLHKPVTLIGSRRTARIHLNSSKVSRAHALVVVTPGGAILRDLLSREGTLVDGRRVTEHDLAGGQEIEIGRFVFTYHDPRPAASTESVGVPGAVLQVGEARHRLGGRVVLVGRRPGSDVRLDDGGVSTAHAALVRLEGFAGEDPSMAHVGWAVVDLGGKGTYVDGKPTRKAILDDGSRLTFGPVKAKICLEPLPEPEPVAEAEPAPVVEAEPEPVAEVEPEPVAEVEPEPVAEVEPEPVAEVEPAPVAEVEPEPVAEVEPEPVAEVEPERVAPLGDLDLSRLDFVIDVGRPAATEVEAEVEAEAVGESADAGDEVADVAAGAAEVAVPGRRRKGRRRRRVKPAEAAPPVPPAVPAAPAVPTPPVAAPAEPEPPASEQLPPVEELPDLAFADPTPAEVDVDAEDVREVRPEPAAPDTTTAVPFEGLDDLVRLDDGRRVLPDDTGVFEPAGELPGDTAFAREVHALADSKTGDLVDAAQTPEAATQDPAVDTAAADPDWQGSWQHRESAHLANTSVAVETVSADELLPVEPEAPAGESRDELAVEPAEEWVDELADDVDGPFARGDAPVTLDDETRPPDMPVLDPSAVLPDELADEMTRDGLLRPTDVFSMNFGNAPPAAPQDLSEDVSDGPAAGHGDPAPPPVPPPLPASGLSAADDEDVDAFLRTIRTEKPPEEYAEESEESAGLAVETPDFVPSPTLPRPRPRTPGPRRATRPAEPRGTRGPRRSPAMAQFEGLGGPDTAGPGRASRTARGLWLAPLLIGLMVSLMIAATAGIWFGMPPRTPVSLDVAHHVPAALPLEEQYAYQSRQLNLTASDATRARARQYLLENHPHVDPAYLNDPLAYNRFVVGAAWLVERPTVLRLHHEAPDRDGEIRRQQAVAAAVVAFGQDDRDRSEQIAGERDRLGMEIESLRAEAEDLGRRIEEVQATVPGAAGPEALVALRNDFSARREAARADVESADETVGVSARRVQGIRQTLTEIEAARRDALAIAARWGDSDRLPDVTDWPDRLAEDRDLLTLRRRLETVEQELGRLAADWVDASADAGTDDPDRRQRLENEAAELRDRIGERMVVIASELSDQAEAMRQDLSAAEAAASQAEARAGEARSTLISLDAEQDTAFRNAAEVARLQDLRRDREERIVEARRQIGLLRHNLDLIAYPRLTGEADVTVGDTRDARFETIIMSLTAIAVLFLALMYVALRPAPARPEPAPTPAAS